MGFDLLLSQLLRHFRFFQSITHILKHASGMSAIYRPKSIGTKMLPCGRPFLRIFFSLQYRANLKGFICSHDVDKYDYGYQWVNILYIKTMSQNSVSWNPASIYVVNVVSASSRLGKARLLYCHLLEYYLANSTIEKS